MRFSLCAVSATPYTPYPTLVERCNISLTAISLIGLVPAVIQFVAHFLHADTVPGATLEHGWTFT